MVECINVTLYQNQLSKQNEQLNSEMLKLTEQKVSILFACI